MQTRFLKKPSLSDQRTYSIKNDKIDTVWKITENNDETTKRDYD